MRMKNLEKEYKSGDDSFQLKFNFAMAHHKSSFKLPSRRIQRDVAEDLYGLERKDFNNLKGVELMKKI